MHLLLQSRLKAFCGSIHVNGFPVYKAEMIELLKRALSFKTKVICLNERQSIFFRYNNLPDTELASNVHVEQNLNYPIQLHFDFSHGILNATCC